MVAQDVLRLEQFEADAAAEAEYLAVQAEYVHLELDLGGQLVGAEVADERVAVVLQVVLEVHAAAQDLAAVAEQVAGRVGEADVRHYLAFALDLQNRSYFIKQTKHFFSNTYCLF